MLKTVFIYSSVLALVLVILKIIEYKYIIHDLTLQTYIGFIAFGFTALGIWLGFKYINKKDVPGEEQSGILPDPDSIKKMGISEREFEVLTLMDKGLSNKEIADKLFVSLNTIKTHVSNIFSKLDVERRTQAIQKARGLNILP